MKFVIYTLTIEKAATLLSDGFMLNFDYSITSQRPVLGEPILTILLHFRNVRSMVNYTIKCNT